MKTIFQLTIASIFFLSSCVGKEENKHKNLDIKKDWSSSRDYKNLTITSSENHTEKQWWKNFNSPTINKIVEIALQNNIDHKIAIARILEARADRSLSSSALIPNFDISQSARHSNTIASIGSQKVDLFNASLDTSWEIDLFNTKKYVTNSKEHLVNSYIANKDQVKTTLIAELIVNYTDYLKYKSLISIKKRNIELHKHDIDIMTSKKLSGVISELELEEKKAEHSKTKSEIYKLNTSMNKAKYRIETLCGIQSGKSYILHNTSTEIPLVSKNIILNSPVNVIQNRPDAQKSIQELLSATSMTKSALSEQYPTITLIKSLGYQRSNISGSNEAISIGQSIVSPILNFQKIRSNIKMYEAKEEQSFLKYKKAMLNIIEDVESSITNYYNAYDTYKELYKGVEYRKKSVELSKHLYDHQVKSYSTVIDSEMNLLKYQTELVTSMSDLSKATVKLYKALGYGV